MSKKIKLSSENRTKIQEAFGVTHASVSQALNFVRNSEQSNKMREMAIRLGGQLVEVEERIIATPQETVKVLDSHGNVKQVMNI